MNKMPIAINSDDASDLFGNFAGKAKNSKQSSAISSNFNKFLADQFSENSKSDAMKTDAKKSETAFRKAAKQSLEEENDINLAFAPYINNAFADSQALLDIRLTNKEVQNIALKLQDKLSDKPINIKDTLNLIVNMGKMPGGVTAREIISALDKDVNKAVKLSDTEQKHIESILNKISSSADDFTSLKEAFTSGNKKDAIDKLLQSINALNSSVDISKEEMQAITKALNLTSETAKTLINKSGKLQPEQVQDLFAYAQTEINSKALEQNKLFSSLENVMQPILKEAQKREKFEESTNIREDKKTFYTKVQIENSSTKKVQEQMEGVSEADKSNRVFNNSDKVQIKVINENKTETKPNENINAKIIEQKIHADKPADNVAVNPKEAKTDAPILDKKQNSKEQGQDLTKEQKKSDFINQTTSAQTIVSPNPLATNANNLVFNLEKPIVSTPSDFAQNIALANQQNVKSLELQLNPVELGAVTVLLQSRNGEVNAIIKPEQAETARILNAQVDQIRRELEDQGIKVGKVEVETGLQQNAGQNSSSFDGNSSSQSAKDFQEQSENLELLRRLAKLDGFLDGKILPENILAQNLHNIDYKASFSQSGIHIVA